jgi:hypothetical protein
MGGDLDPHLADMHMAWAMPTALTWLLAASCAVAAWLAGYGMGYRRGVKDAINDNIINAEHRVNGD